ncbi:MAG: alpha/beta hydrolase [Opitutaceae bacterium]|nr:alpha/beta hydrolase [Opitutaceae bacterium]
MRRSLKIARNVILTLLVVIAAGIAALLVLRTIRQHANEKTFAITSAGGIDEAGYIEIGGIKQWIQVRGQDRNNPVLLCVHGGPGGTWLPVTRLFAAWEKDFTVVLWDERGAGKTLAATGPGIAGTMNIERMAQDGIEVAEHLHQRLGQDKIILLGHSFGSILGTRMVKSRPELFHAFVGTGQASDLPRSVALEYARLVELAKAHGDARSQRELAAIGPPPFSSRQQANGFFQCAQRYQARADSTAMAELQRSFLSPPPNYTLGDEWNRMRGFMAVPTWSLYQKILSTNLSTLGFDFQVPVFLFQGTDDHVTPPTLAEEYYNSIKAPHKELVRIEGGGHFAAWSHATQFHVELVRRVRPYAMKSSRAL